MRYSLLDEFIHARSFVEFAHENQATIGGYACAVEIHRQRAIERGLKRAAFVLTDWPSSTAPPNRQVRSSIASERQSFRGTDRTWLAVKPSSTSVYTYTNAARQAYSKCCRTERQKSPSRPLLEDAACDLEVMTGGDIPAFVLALLLARLLAVIAHLHRAFIDINVSEPKAIRVFLIRVCAEIFTPLGPANRSDGVGGAHFKCRQTAAHSAEDYRVQMAAEQSDPAGHTDSVHHDALVYRQHGRRAQL